MYNISLRLSKNYCFYYMVNTLKYCNISTLDIKELGLVKTYKFYKSSRNAFG